VSKIHKKHLTTDAGILELVLTAFCDTVERREKVAAPYTMLDADEVHKASGDQLLKLVAETQAEYGQAPPPTSNRGPGSEKQSA